MRRFFVRLLIASSSSMLAAALAGCKPPASAVNGAAVFHRNCAPCHRPEGTDTIAPSLELYYAKSPAPSDRRTRIIIREGGNFMPPFGQRLSNQQIDDLIAYLKTLPKQPMTATSSR